MPTSVEKIYSDKENVCPYCGSKITITTDSNNLITSISIKSGTNPKVYTIDPPASEVTVACFCGDIRVSYSP
ncbi:MAG: hypothetical protein ACTSX6_00360 [Candidatus Heimdallarchaeaceae archaeon]